MNLGPRLDLSRFIVNYPTRDDRQYGEKMGNKYEFVELMQGANTPSSVDPFFYNYQILVGRWMAPWTNNRILTLYWDPGVGKTRGGLSFALMWMRYSSHKKTILLADSDIILRAIQEEVVKYNSFDVELEQRNFKMGPKGHGKLIAKTQHVKKHGFEKQTITAFMNEIRKNAEQEGVSPTDYIRRHYSDYNFIIDEVHTLRRTSEDKSRYRDTITLLDAVRDICAVLLLTATPIVDKWKDIFSTVGMMYPPEVREYLYSQIDPIPVYTQDTAIIDNVTRLLGQYAFGMFSSRRSMGVVPQEIPLTTDGPTNYRVEAGERPVVLYENIYPVFMSDYQTSKTEEIGRTEEGVRERSEIARGQVTEDIEGRIQKKDSFYTTSRQLYDFAPPTIRGETISKIASLIVEDNRRFVPSSLATIVTPGSTENEQVFKVYWETREVIRPDGSVEIMQVPSQRRGLGMYSAKYAELIRMLTFDPRLQNRAGYVHTLWVQEGIMPIAASLFVAGWEQYTGIDTISAPGPNPRFAIIYGDSSENQIARIIETFNSPANRDGSILRLVVGSKKSGISISFTNARFFIEMSADFNKTTRIQAKGRVFRADSLLWLPKEERNVYTASIVSLPFGMQNVEDIQNGIIRNELYDVELESIEMVEDPITGEMVEQQTTTVVQLNPATIEINMYYLSEIKHEMASRMLEVVDNVSIERIIEGQMRGTREYDMSTYNLLYGQSQRENTKAHILSNIPYDWTYPLQQNDMNVMRSAAELISSHSYALTRYGFPRPINSFSNVISAYNASAHGAQSFALIYDRNFFLVEENKRYTPESIRRAIAIVDLAPSGEFDFYSYISRPNFGDVKTIILEIALAMPEGILSVDEMRKFERIRHHVLNLYSMFWDTFGGGRLIHILWYGIKKNSHLSKLGINSTPELNTRIITYDIATESTNNRWSYMDSKEREAIYLSGMARKIQDAEERAMERAEPYGYYVHFSVYDGMLRVREIQVEDLRKSKAFDVSLADAGEIVASIMNTSLADLQEVYGDDLQKLREDVFLQARALGILVIR